MSLAARHSPIAEIRQGSFRITEDELRAMGLPEPRVFAVPANALVVADTFGFHALAVDDALHEIHVPKLDDWGDYLYIVLHDVAYDHQKQVDTEVVMRELDVFLGRTFIVTYHPEPITAVESVWEAWQRDERLVKHGCDHLLYHLIDELVNNYISVVEDMEEARTASSFAMSMTT